MLCFFNIIASTARYEEYNRRIIGKIDSYSYSVVARGCSWPSNRLQLDLIQYSPFKVQGRHLRILKLSPEAAEGHTSAKFR